MQEERIQHLKKVIESPVYLINATLMFLMESLGITSLDTGCIYCNYKHDCWSDANDGKGLRIFKYSTGQ